MKITTIKELQSEQNALAELLSEKGIVCPAIHVTTKSGGRVEGWFHCDGYIDGELCINFNADSVDDLIGLMWKRAKNLPDPKTKAAHDFSARLAKVIEFGRDNGIDDEYIDPLVVTREAMTENLLTVQS